MSNTMAVTYKKDDEIDYFRFEQLVITASCVEIIVPTEVKQTVKIKLKNIKEIKIR